MKDKKAQWRKRKGAHLFRALLFFALLLGIGLQLSKRDGPLKDPGEMQSSRDEEEKEDGEMKSGEAIVDRSSIIYSYEQMREDLYMLAARYPDRLSLESLGLSADGRDLFCASLGSRKASHHILVHGSIHAREYVNSLLLMSQIESLCAREEGTLFGEVSLKELLSKVCLHIIPMANPDGVAICQKGPEGIKNPALRRGLLQIRAFDLAGGTDAGTKGDEALYWKRWKANAWGVDLNRNFDARWEEVDSTEAPSAMRYKGMAPHSEREVRAILDLSRAYPMEAVISCHSSGNLIYWEDLDNRARDVQRELSALLCNVLGYGENHGSAAMSPGGCSNYFYEVEEIPALTVENGPNGGDQLYPLGGEILPELLKANESFLLSLARYFYSRSL